MSEGVAFGGYDMEGRGEGIPIGVSAGVGEGHVARTWVQGMYRGYHDTDSDETKTEEKGKQKSEGPICIDSLIINQEGLVSIPPR